MRIAVLAPLSWRVPPRHYGPWEQFCSDLTEGLVARGHDVTLFASGDSVTKAHLESVIPRGWSEDASVDPKVAECLHISGVFERSGDFDLIHNSFDFLPLTYSRLITTPVVTTIHGFSSPAITRVYEQYNSTAHYVAISDADRHPDLDYVATVHHGIDTDALPVSTGAATYLASFGRIHPDKGTATAIKVAKAAGIPLRIAGIVHDERYFAEEVAPHIDGTNVEYVGPVMAEDRAAFLGEARALLHLIDFEEPFGYSVVEAMSCGTPVVAYGRGSMPELIEEGLTGTIVDDLEGATEACMRLDRFDRSEVGQRARQRFDVSRMVDAYVRVYESVTEASPTAQALSSNSLRRDVAVRRLGASAYTS